MTAIVGSRLPKYKACRIIGIEERRFYRWKSRYKLFGISGLDNGRHNPKVVVNRLLPEEESTIIDYAIAHPKQRHREIQFNLERRGVFVSFSSVYRRLKEWKLIKSYKLNKSRGRGYERPKANYPHEIWMVDISYILVNDKFWYLIAVIDLYSRYIVGWALSSSMRADDVKRVIDFSLLEFGFHDSENKPRIHMDNGSQMTAKTLKAFLRGLGMINEYSRPHLPQDSAEIERFFRTLKQGEVYREEYMDPYEARDGIGHFIEYYNHRRPHQGIGFVTPYERLTGQDEHIKKERKINSLYAQRIRMSKNKGLFLICPEETMSLISLNKNF